MSKKRKLMKRSSRVAGRELSELTRIGSGARRDAYRTLTRLEHLNVLRKAALPIAAIAAGLSAATMPAIFPIASSLAAIVVGLGEWFNRKERSNLQRQIIGLEAYRAVAPDEIKKIESATNRLTVGGPSE